MKDAAVAARYARALFEAADQMKKAAFVRRELEQVVKALRQEEALAKWLSHPLVSLNQKKAALNKSSGTLSALTERFLELLIEKRRLALVTQISYAFGELEDQSQGILRAHVRSPWPLSGALVRKLEEALSHWSGKRVIADISMDEHVLGGLLVRVGDKILDGTVINQLAQLREQLVA